MNLKRKQRPRSKPRWRRKTKKRLKAKSMSDVELPPQTAPENIGVSLRGFADEPSAQKFGHLIADTVRSLSHYMDLRRLDGITVAYDYDNALAQLDRGYAPSAPLAR